MLSIIAIIGGTIVPLMTLMIGIARAARLSREALLAKIDHIHACIHRLENRIVVIETRSRASRRTDLPGNDER